MSRIRTSDLVKGSAVLATALAWNNAAQIFIDSVYPLKKDGAWASFVYAIFVTVLSFVALIMFNEYEKVADDIEGK